MFLKVPICIVSCNFSPNLRSTFRHQVVFNLLANNYSNDSDMGCQKVARIILLILSLVFSLAGVAILGAGVFQPYWQHVDMRGMPGIDSEWFGLYEDCMHMTDNSQQAGWTCYYKWITHDSQLRIQLKEECE